MLKGLVTKRVMDDDSPLVPSQEVIQQL